MRLHGRDYLSVDDLRPDELWGLIEFARHLKARSAAGDRPPLLAGKTLAMVFEKPSLRTRVSFEVGFSRLGGTVVFLDHQGTPIGARESIGDYGRNLERWCDVLVARTFAHATVEALAESTSIPVINALSDLEHPCQALADAFTLAERHPDLPTAALAYVGDGGNNVCHSLLLTAALLGFRLTVIAPPQFRPRPQVLALAMRLARTSGAILEVTADLGAVAGHDAVYTDTWVSMGTEARAGERREILGRYRVDAALMARAGSDALFMHCLPAHRGEEVTDEVIDSRRSVVFEQAENRMHVQNAILLHLLAPGMPRAASPRPAPAASRF
jgi:ornithine carbamoyltransferase